MKSPLQLILPLALLPLIGCVTGGEPNSGYRKVSLSTVRYVDFQSGKSAEQNVFSNREMIIAILRNLASEDQLYKVEFVRSDNGQVVHKDLVQLRSNRMGMIGPPKPLPAGAYVVKVTGAGISPVLHAFAVLGR